MALYKGGPQNGMAGLCLCGLLCVGALVGLIVLAGVIAKLSEYWNHESQKDNNAASAINSFATTLYLSDLLGLPMAAIGSLIFLASAILIVAMIAGNYVWDLGLDHITLVVITASVIAAVVVIVLFSREQDIEFGLAHGRKAPTTASWVMGLTVVIITVTGAPKVAAYVHSFTPRGSGDVSSIDPVTLPKDAQDRTVQSTPTDSFEPQGKPVAASASPAGISSSVPVVDSRVENSSPAQANSWSARSTDAEVQPQPAKEKEAVNDQTDVLQAISVWREAMLSNDPSRLADCYAQHVDRYFLQTNVDNAYVLQYLKKMQARGDSFVTIELHEPTFPTKNDSTVEVDFNEDFSFVERGQFKSKRIRTILKFAKVDGNWKIYYERQLYV